MSWPPKNPQDVIAFLADKGTDHDSGFAEQVTPPWSMTPAEYVRFSRTDLKQGGQRGLVNALGNAKRSLHCQVDSILFCACLWPQMQHSNFPHKIERVAAMGIATAGVLRRINQHRNEVEHEYALPKDRAWLEDLVDTVDLFVRGTDRFARTRYWESFSRSFRNTERVLEFSLDGEAVVVKATAGVGDVWKAAGRVRVEPRNRELPALMAAYYSALVRTGAPL